MSDTFLDFTRYDIAESALNEVAEIKGDEKSEVIVFVRKNDFQNEEQKLLSNIIGAVNLKQEPLICALTSDSRIRTGQIESFSRFKYVLLFGLSLKDVSIHARIPLYNVYIIGEQKVVLSEGLDVLSGDQQKKRLLWNCMKEMFPVKR